METHRVKNQIYIIPVGAAVPTELSSLHIAEGSFLARVLRATEDGGILPLAPLELGAISKSPEVFDLAGAIVIDGLPGAFYDPLFISSASRLGISVELWESIKAMITKDSITAQRTADKRPWQKPLSAEDVEAGQREHSSSAPPSPDDMED